MWEARKSQGMTMVSRFHHLWTVNVCPRFHGNNNNKKNTWSILAFSSSVFLFLFLSLSIFRHLSPSGSVWGCWRTLFPSRTNNRYPLVFSLLFSPFCCCPSVELSIYCFLVPQLHDVGGREGDLEHQSPDREPMLSPIIPTRNPSLDLELHWQDLLTIMGPQVTGRIE